MNNFEEFNPLSMAMAIFAMVVFSVLFGWVIAHNTVATECQKLGSFYVNNKIFECKLKGEK